MNSYIEMKLQVAMVYHRNQLPRFSKRYHLSHWFEHFPTYNINFTWKSLFVPHGSYV